MVEADLFQRCLNAAIRYLSYRPRSEAELRLRLHRRKFNDDIIEWVILNLKQRQLVDDVAFAQFWKENRESFSPRSQRLLKQELNQKGIDPQTIDEVTRGFDDELGAYQAGQRKVRTLAGMDYQSFQRKLGGFLKRRGFDYGVIGQTIDRLWQEQRQPDGSSLIRDTKRM